MAYLPAAPFDELVPGRARICLLEGMALAVVRDGDAVAVVSSLCTHAAAPLDRGRASHGSITCPVHGARFDLRSGACVNAPYDPLRVYPCRVVDGQVEVDVDSVGR
jgi:3-phenylpropionate/trans-cinnamate dioxygenase ferredoxin subunit